METNIPAITIRQILYNEVGFPYHVPPHSHSVYQWYCLVFGSVDYSIDGKIYKLNPGDTILISPDVTRYPTYSYRSTGYFYVLLNILGLNLKNLPENLITIPNELQNDFTTLVREINKPGDNTYHYVEALVTRLLIGINRSLQNNETLEYSSSLNIQAKNEFVERVEAYMRRHLHRELNHKELSKEFSISTSQLSRIFKNSTGMTLSKYLFQLRINKAKQLLLESSFPISEISLMIGYTSFSHFSLVFRQELGLTPGDYRRTKGNIQRNLEISQ